MEFNYIIEIEEKKIKTLEKYYELLTKLFLLESEEENFEEKILSYSNDLTLLMDDFKEYDKIFNNLIKDNKNALVYIDNKISIENELLKKIDNLIEKIVAKFSKEKLEIEKKIENIKIKDRNLFSENNPLTFEKKI